MDISEEDRRERIANFQRLIDQRTAADIARDMRICGVSLEESEVSPFAISHGAVDTISTPYGSLEVLLGKEPFGQDDMFLDVGCGKGRPLAYMVDIGFPGRIVGVELTPSVADFASSWARRYPNVKVISGDVFDLDLSEYTVFFMWYAMLPEVFARFIEKLETEAVKPARLFFLSDEDSDDFMDGRPRWTLMRRDWIHMVDGVLLHGCPERYSVWSLQ